jgi:hypothetical protein
MKTINQAFESALAILVLLSIFIPTFIHPTANAVPNNLIQNSSFESLSGANPAGWTRTATGSIDAYFETAVNDAKSGQYSAYFETNGGEGEAFWMPNSSAVTGNTSHTYSLWYTTNKPLTVKASYVLSDNSKQIVTLGTLSASANTYKQTAITFVTPQTAIGVSVFVAMQGTAWGHIDDIRLVSNAANTTVVNTSAVGVSTPISPILPNAAPATTIPTIQPLAPSTPLATASQPVSPTPASSPTTVSALEAPTGTPAPTVTKAAAGVDNAYLFPQSNAVVGKRNMTFSVVYRGTKQLDVKAEYTLSTGETSYGIIGNLTPSPAYKQISFTFTTPENIVSIRPYISKSGATYANLDDVSFTNSALSVAANQQPVSSPIVPVTPPIDQIPTPPLPPTQLQQEGRWRTVGLTSLVAIQAASLPGGKVLLFDGTDGVGEGDDRTLNYEIFNTSARTQQRFQAKETGGNLIQYAAFCAGMAILPGGDIFFAGGDTNGDAFGSNKAGLYSAITNTWRMVARMNSLRWYPSAIQTFSGDLLVVGGTQQTYQTPATTPEIYNLATNSWRNLTGATDNFDLDYGGTGHFYPWLYNLPNGNVANLGPRPTISIINPAGNGSLTRFAYRDLYDNDNKFSSRNQTYGSVARVSANQVLTVGGGTDPVANIPNLPANWERVDAQGSTETANLVNLQSLAGAAPTAGGQDQDFTTQTGNPIQPRTNAALVITANGDVMYTGGSAANEANNRNVQYDSAVQTPEIWNIDRGTWLPLAQHPSKRIYHMTALLQKDGTIIQAGGAGFNGRKCRYYRKRCKCLPSSRSLRTRIFV